jgi:acyl-coenzyme A synthetase/AMP-(fatty) acid ligase
MATVFGDLLERLGADARAPAALVAGQGETSYAALAARVRARAAGLRADGLGPREIVGIAVADEALHLETALALLALGVPQVALPTFEPIEVRRRLAARLGVTRVVAASSAEAIDGLALSRCRPGSERDAAHAAPIPFDADPDAIALFSPSSGTTGEPKIVAMSQRLLAIRHARRGYERGERILVPASVEHSRWMLSRLATLGRGCTCVFASGANPTAREIAAASGRHRVSRIDVGVLHLANFASGDDAALGPDVKIFASGSRVPARLRRTVRERTGATVYVEYGARETGAVTSTYPRERDPDRETVGAPLFEGEVEVVDPDGRPVAVGEVGEIRVRYDGMPRGYHGDAVATARQFRDGAFHPGDLGAFAPGGSLCLAGRTDDAMNLNGIKVYPLEIERVMEDEPGVRSAAAFALDSATHGQIPVVAVEWDGTSPADPAELQARARARLGLRSPRKVLVVDALPRNAAGKVDRAALARLAAAR